MTFAAPAALLGLLALPLLVWLYVRHEHAGRARREAFAPAALLASVAPMRPGWRRHVPVAILGLALAALVVALARPQATVAVEVDQATIVIVSDRSGSMRAADVAPTRLEAVRRAAAEFLEAVPADVRVAAVTFNQRAHVIQGATRDHAAVAEALAGVEAGGGTATGDGLASALDLIASARGEAEQPPPAAVVLLSDGKSSHGRDPIPVAQEARAARVPVYTVALGTDTGTIRPRSGNGREVTVPPDPETLSRIAEISGGRAFAVADAERLREVYERLGEQLVTEDRKQEVTGAFAGGALLLLVAAVGASLRWFGRVL